MHWTGGVGTHGVGARGPGAPRWCPLVYPRSQQNKFIKAVAFSPPSGATLRITRVPAPLCRRRAGQRSAAKCAMGWVSGVMRAGTAVVVHEVKASCLGVHLV